MRSVSGAFRPGHGNTSKWKRNLDWSIDVDHHRALELLPARDPNSNSLPAGFSGGSRLECSRKWNRRPGSVWKRSQRWNDNHPESGNQSGRRDVGHTDTFYDLRPGSWRRGHFVLHANRLCRSWGYSQLWSPLCPRADLHPAWIVCDFPECGWRKCVRNNQRARVRQARFGCPRLRCGESLAIYLHRAIQ